MGPGDMERCHCTALVAYEHVYASVPHQNCVVAEGAVWDHAMATLAAMQDTTLRENIPVLV